MCLCLLFRREIWGRRIRRRPCLLWNAAELLCEIVIDRVQVKQRIADAAADRYVGDPASFKRVAQAGRAAFVDTEDGFVRVDDQKQVCVRSVGQQMRPRIVPTDLLHEPRQQRRQLIAQFLLLRQPQQQNNDPIVELILEA